MNDTQELMQAEFKRRLMNLTCTERLIMGADMFDSARKMVLSSFPKGLSPSEVKLKLLYRFYGHDFDGRQYSDIVRYFEDKSK